MHEILHKKTVGGGFSHPQMIEALNSVAPGMSRDLYTDPQSSLIGKICF